MAKWWLGVPLIALGWANSASAQAPPPYGPMVQQPLAPGGYGPAPQMPTGYPGPGMESGGMLPGGYPPMMPPPGMPVMPMPTLDPGPPYSLPADDDAQGNAFSPGHSEVIKGPQPQCYAGVGFMGLVRQSLGHGVIASVDPGINIPGIPNNVDTGNNPPNTAPTALSFSDISPEFNWGTKVTVGYRFGCDAVEFTGYYLGLSTSASEVSLPGQLDLPFSAFNSPLGFQGDNFLWLQADLVRIVQETRVANAEFNYRCQYTPNVEWIAGLRYMDVQERFSIATDDDGIVLTEMGLPPDPLLQATYIINTHNRILAPQLGLNLEQCLVSWLTVSCEMKGAWGANFFSQDHLLLRGDGFEGPSSHIATTLFSHVYDLGLYANFMVGDHFRVKAGYQALWIVDVPVASQQVDFDPNNAKGRMTTDGSIFFHGPSVEFLFTF